MTRWHLLRNGRIVKTAWSSDGDCAMDELRPFHSGDVTDMVCSDADWWAMQHRRALRGVPLGWNPLKAANEHLRNSQPRSFSPFGV